MSRLWVKVVLPSIATVIVGVAIAAVLILQMVGSGVTALNSKYVNALTEKYSSQVEHQMQASLGTAVTLSRTIEAMAASPFSVRDEVIALTSNILEDRKELIGIGVGFEPNAFDERDSEFIGADHSNDQGRFLPYMFIENGSPAYTILTGYDDQGPDGSWYHVPKETKKTYVTDPYWYEVGNEKFLIFTCVAPILSPEGKFIGMVGFDTKVSTVKEIVEQATLFETGYLSLVSPDGTIAYHPKEDLIGTNFGEHFDDILSNAIRASQESGTTRTVDTYTISGEKAHFTITPFQVGDSGGTWATITVVKATELSRTLDDTVRTIMIIGLIVIVFIVIVLSLILTRVVIRPVRLIKKATGEIAQGHLDIKIPYRSKDEFGQLSTDLENTSKTLKLYVNDISSTLGEMASGNMAVPMNLEYIGDFIPIKTSLVNILEQLNVVLSQLSVSSAQISSQSYQITDGAQLLSQGVIEQASAVEELSVKIDEITAQFKKIATDSAEVNNGAQAVESQASLGNKQMQSLLEAMNEINRSSSEIQKIIKSIEDIAFQTNILALNAAVEAARAGAAGKGFAVVAEEVRNLATKSAEASKTTAELIDTSLSAVKKGVDIAHDAAEALVTMTDGINTVSSTIDVIASESDNQAVSVEQIAQSVSQISTVVQTNSGTAEEYAATSEELSAQAQLFMDLVGHFKLTSDEDPTE